MGDLRPLGSGTARLGGRLGRGVGLSFAAWPAGWVSPSRRGSGVGLLWAMVVAGLTGGGGWPHRCWWLYRSEKRKKKISVVL